MIMLALGIIDILTGLLFFINNSLIKFPPSKVIWILGIYLIVKGIIFLLSVDVASTIDIICGIIVLLSLPFIIPKLLAVIVTIYLVQKGIFSIIS